MVKEEILEGLRASLSRGEPLRQAMMSFYNAGYSKKDVEEAANILSSPQVPAGVQQPAQTPPVQPQPTTPSTTSATQTTPPVQQAIQQAAQAPMQPAQQPMQLAQQIQQPAQQPGLIQKVSGYGTEKKSMGTIAMIILVLFLIGLLGILVAVFLFKDEISKIFGNILSLLF